MDVMKEFTFQVMLVEKKLKIKLHNLVRPKFFIPVHGEYHHIVKHAKLAESIGMPKENIFISEIGQVLEFTRDKGQVVGKVTSGKVLIDGLGVGDVGNIVLRDRPSIISRWYLNRSCYYG